ncbi:helix-turn-helix domain-containing protein [Micromonospora sp. NPDC048063]|uniref:helix-turn-helix domain-containing protein n=1 Tax=Micromonospora sp. NPDC048063 TaxID=3364256 RepID=UPI00371459F7
MGSAPLRWYIGHRLEALRRKTGLTQEQAAGRLQTGRATIAWVEEGHEGVASSGRVCSVAGAYAPATERLGQRRRLSAGIPVRGCCRC